MAISRVTGHGSEDEALEGDWNLGVDLSGTPWLAEGQVGRKALQGQSRGDHEGTVEGQGLEERDTERVEIAEDLVCRRPEQPLRGHVHGRARAVAHLLDRGDLQVAAQTQVAEINATSVADVDQDVCRLDVAVNHASECS